jgi:hypothetical protein
MVLSMALYTFVMEYLGGTYMAQVRARSVAQACVNWARSLEAAEIQGLGPRGHQELVVQMTERMTDAVPLDGLENAWCHSALPRGRFALINIIQTAG